MVSFFGSHFIEIAIIGASFFGLTLLSVSIIENVKARP
jgi:hypothetical protein